ncbi:hypothetical protein Hanom_Chr10g00881951 [Helianthus anomalus]
MGLDLANGLGRVGSWVKTGWGQNGSFIKKGCFGSGRNRSGSERVWVRAGPGQNRFRVGSVFFFFFDDY